MSKMYKEIEKLIYLFTFIMLALAIITTFILSNQINVGTINYVLIIAYFAFILGVLIQTLARKSRR